MKTIGGAGLTAAVTKGVTRMLRGLGMAAAGLGSAMLLTAGCSGAGSHKPAAAGAAQLTPPAADAAGVAADRRFLAGPGKRILTVHQLSAALNSRHSKSDCQTAAQKLPAAYARTPSAVADLAPDEVTAALAADETAALTAATRSCSAATLTQLADIHRALDDRLRREGVLK